jgi:hypothetical protein
MSQHIFGYFSGSAIQHMVETTVPWLHMIALSLKIFKSLRDLQDKKDKDD